MAITYVNGKDKLAAYLAKLTAIEKVPPAVPEATAVPAVIPDAIECMEPKTPTEAGKPGMLAGIIATAKKLPGPKSLGLTLPPGTAKERLRILVAHEIEHAPHLHSHLMGSTEPLAWAAHRPPWYAAKLGVSLDTFNEVTGAAPGKAPFCKQVMRPKAGAYKGEVLTLLRLGDPQVEKIPEDLARVMSAYFRKATARPTIRPDEFGCLVGLAEEWGLNAPAVFKTVVTHWSLFMPIVHSHIDMVTAYAEEHGWKLKSYHLKRTYPSIPTMRLFAMLGPEFHNDQLQASFDGDDPNTLVYV